MAAAAVLCSAAPSLALDDPDQLVRALYRLEYGFNGPGVADRFLAADAAAAYKLQLAADEPKGATGFDWRYDAQDIEISDLVIETSDPGVRSGPQGARAVVQVSFRNFGQPAELTYELCLASAGWRIADVVRPADEDREPWSLRELLAIPAEPVHC